MIIEKQVGFLWNDPFLNSRLTVTFIKKTCFSNTPYAASNSFSSEKRLEPSKNPYGDSSFPIHVGTTTGRVRFRYSAAPARCHTATADTAEVTEFAKTTGRGCSGG